MPLGCGGASSGGGRCERVGDVVLAAERELDADAALRRAQAELRAEPARIDRRLPQSPLTVAERTELRAFLESLTDRAFLTSFAPGGRSR